MPVILRFMIPETVFVQFLQEQNVKVVIIINQYPGKHYSQRLFTTEQVSCSNLYYKKDPQFPFIAV